MIFYNPFFSGFPPFPFEKSTNSSRKVDNIFKKSSFYSQRQNNEVQNNVDIPAESSNYIVTSKNFSETSKRQSDNKKSNPKFSFSLGKFNDYLQETDSLILLALLYFLYTQKSSSGPLMICLLLLLLDDD